MKEFKIILAAIVITVYLASCSDKNFEVVPQAELQYIVYSENNLSNVLVSQGLFWTITQSEGKTNLTSFSPDGEKKTVCDLFSVFNDSLNFQFGIYETQDNRLAVIMTEGVEDNPDSLLTINCMMYDHESGQTEHFSHTKPSDNVLMVKVLPDLHGGLTLLETKIIQSEKQQIGMSSQVSLTNISSEGIVNESGNIEGLEKTEIAEIIQLSSGDILVLSGFNNRQGMAMPGIEEQKKIMQIDAQGNLISTVNLSAEIASVSAVKIAPSEIILAGTTNSETGGNISVLTSISHDGRLLWERMYDLSYTVYNITETNTGYVMACGTPANNNISSNWADLYNNSNRKLAWFVVDKSGNLIDSELMPHEYAACGISAMETSPGEYSILGIKSSFSVFKNMIMVKTQ